MNTPICCSLLDVRYHKRAQAQRAANPGLFAAARNTSPMSRSFALPVRCSGEAHRRRRATERSGSPAMEGKRRTADYLLERGANPNWLPSWENRTPLDAAVATTLQNWWRGCWNAAASRRLKRSAIVCSARASSPPCSAALSGTDRVRAQPAAAAGVYAIRPSVRCPRESAVRIRRRRIDPDS